MSDRAEEAAFLPLEARLARRLVALSEDYGAEINVSQEALGCAQRLKRSPRARMLASCANRCSAKRTP